MTTQHTCRYCGAHTNIPQLFKGTSQRVFAYIWNNPDCTVKEIQAALFTKRSKANIAGVLVSKVKRDLIGTGYIMITIAMSNGKPCRNPYQLQIVPSKSETQPHVPTQLPSRLR